MTAAKCIAEGQAMPRGNNQKIKLYRLAQIMAQKTDGDHYLSMPQIMEELAKYEVTADRKTIYVDLADLKIFGLEVEHETIGRWTGYHVVSRNFDLPELKLLVDAIQSSKFITARKSNELIKKIESLCSEHEAKQLQRQVFVQARIKSMNESIYNTVDTIHYAITENKKIKFKYFSWNIKKEQELRHNGAFYEISPWALTWDDENYYLIGYDSNDGKVKHYRVDKMIKISPLDQPREGREFFDRFDTAEYAKKNFAMFGGEEEDVTVWLKNDMCGVFIDRFGTDISFKPVDEDHCTVRLHVAMSQHFIGWIFALGNSVKIIGPDSVLTRVRKEIDRISGQYI